MTDKKYTDIDFLKMKYKIDPKKLITDQYPEFLKHEIFSNLGMAIETGFGNEKANSLFAYVIYCFDEGTPFFEGNSNTERKMLSIEKAGIKSKDVIEALLSNKIDIVNDMTAVFFRHTNNLGIEVFFSELEYLHTINSRLRDPNCEDNINIYKAGFDLFDKISDLKKKLFNDDKGVESVVMDDYQPRESFGKIEKMLSKR